MPIAEGAIHFGYSHLGTRARTDLKFSSLRINFHGIRGTMQMSKGRKQLRVLPNYANYVHNDQHSMRTLRVNWCYPFLGGDKQLSDCTGVLLKKRENISGTRNLVNYQGLVKS